MTFTVALFQRSIPMTALWLTVMSLTGCRDDNESLGQLREVVRNVSQKPSANLANGPLGKPTDSLPKFSPPYPERENAFEYPGTSTNSPSVDAVSSVGEIRVLGFANVGQLRVLLKSKNHTKSLAVGDRFDGIEIVNIHPPSVELRSGTLIWTSTMFDKSR